MLHAHGNLLLANVMTPSQGYLIQQLIFGNLLVAVIESLVLRCLVRRPLARLFGRCLIANYVSTIVGAILIGPVCTQLHASLANGQPLLNAQRVLVGCWVAAFCITAILEAPFFYGVVPSEKRLRVLRALAISFILQLASYALFMVPYYSGFGHVSLLKEVRIERDAHAFLKPAPAWLYYVRRADRSVWRMRLDGSWRQEKVADSPSGDRWERLYLTQSQVDNKAIANRADLWYGDTSLLVRQIDHTHWRTNGDQLFQPFLKTDKAANLDIYELDLRSDENKTWSLRVGGINPWSGIVIQQGNHPNSSAPILHQWALATPYQSCYFLRGVILPTGQVILVMSTSTSVFLGEYLVLLDVETKQMAVLEASYDAIVIPDATDAERPGFFSRLMGSR